MRFQCLHCKGIVAIDDNDAGQAVACGHCNAVVAVPQTRLSSGAAIDDFVIQKELGQGGMGRVFLAHQVSLDRPAALKVLHSQFSQDHEFINDFIKEARAAARLNHPGIVQAYAVGEDDGIFFFAMEFVEGSTLKQLLSHSGRIVVDRALEITGRIAEALESAWQNEQLVHRDIKPDNIILTAKGEIKLADLGLARKASDILTEGETDILGTPQYISPEQLLGEGVDNRSDLYSLGATLYHALTGSFPFTGDHPAEIARKHLSEALVPAHKLIKDIPKEVSDLVSILMSKKAVDRYQSAGELAADIQRMRSGKGLKRKLIPDSQKPFDMFAEPGQQQEQQKGSDGEDGKHAGMTGKRTISISKSGAKRGTLPLTAKGGKNPAAATGSLRSAKTGKVDPLRQAAATTGTPVAATTTTKGLGKHKAKPAADGADEKKGKTGTIIGIVLLVLALTAGAVFLVINAGKTPSPGGPAQEGVPPEQQAAMNEIKALIASGATYDRVLPEIVKFRTRFGDQTRLHSLLLELAAPFTEAEIREQRSREHKETLKQFEDKAATLRRLAAEEQARRQREEEIEKAKQKEAELKAALAAQARERIEGLVRKTDELRAECAKLCREFKFSPAAKSVFTDMAVSSEPKFAAWANGMREAIDQAQLAIDLLRKSGGAAEGRDIALPAKYYTEEINARKATPKVVRFQMASHSVSVSFKAFVLDEYGMKKRNQDGSYVEEEVAVADVPLMELGLASMWQWTEFLARRKVDPDEIRLQFGCFLVLLGERQAVESLWSKLSNERTTKFLKLLDPLTVD